MEHAHNQTTFQDAVVFVHGRSAVAHVKVDADAGRETMPISPDCERVPSAGAVAGSPDASRKTMPIPPDCERDPGSGITAGVTDAGWETMSIPLDYIHKPGAGVATGAAGPDRETMPIPPDCERVPGNDSDAGDPFFVRFYVDDGILVEVRLFQNGRRFRRVIESLASDHFRLLGPHGSRDPPLLKAHKILGRSTRLEVLGRVLDTDKLTIFLPCRKSSKLRQILADWPNSRHSATCKQIVDGFLIACVGGGTPWEVFVQRLLAYATMPLSLAAVFLSSSERSRR